VRHYFDGIQDRVRGISQAQATQYHFDRATDALYHLWKRQSIASVAYEPIQPTASWGWREKSFQDGSLNLVKRETLKVTQKAVRSGARLDTLSKALSGRIEPDTHEGSVRAFVNTYSMRPVRC